MARIVAFAVAIEVRNSGRIKSRRARCRSSVVEHPLGKGEVVSSILTGSTTAVTCIAPLISTDHVMDAAWA
jgi:hypothetical protein